MNLDKSIWGVPHRLRKSLFKLAQGYLIFTIIIIFDSIIGKSWILLVVSLLNLITPLIIIISKLKYDKEVPQ